MNYTKVAEYIEGWLIGYANSGNIKKSFVLGVSGGIDSAVVASLCARTGIPTLLVTMPIHQIPNEESRAEQQIAKLIAHHNNVWVETIDLTATFDTLKKQLQDNFLVLANTRARLRMTALYALAGQNNAIVVGTGNKIEDFGIGFFTKYGDGGVDISPIGGLMKSEVYALGKELGVIESILNARPTDGLWADGRTDEDQIGATYDELEWAMKYVEATKKFHAQKLILTDREKEVLEIYTSRNRANQHKMNPIPVCEIPVSFK